MKKYITILALILKSLTYDKAFKGWLGIGYTFSF